MGAEVGVEDLFERAYEFDYLERNGTQAQQHDLG